MACIVPNCQQAKLSNEKLSMHLFPDPMRCPKRHLKWVQSIGSEKLVKFDPFVVFKRFRVCRNHFSKDCFNGECKKLQPTAIPTLYLPNQPLKSKSFHDYEEKILLMLKKNSVNVEDDSLKLITLEEVQEEPEKLWNNMDKDGNDEEFMLMEVENGENQTQFTIVMPQTENLTPVIPKIPKVLNYNRKISMANQRISNTVPFSKAKLKLFRTNFVKNPKNLLAQNIISKLSVYDATCFAEEDSSNFDHRIDIKIPKNFKKIHWSSTPFVLLAVPFMKKFNLKEFEFSQTHFLYYERLERCYYYLNKVVETLESTGTSIDCLELFRSNDLLKDGGRWNMFASIVNKYGLMPKEAFPKDLSKEMISSLNDILKMKLRQYTKDLFDIWQSSRNNITQLIDSQMNEIYDILSLCVGTPPEQFIWDHDDLDNESTTLTPLEFYEKYVMPHSNLNDLQCLINDPRPILQYRKLYTTDSFEGIVGGNSISYNNQPTEILFDAATKSVLNDEPVLVICASNGLNSFKLKNFQLLCDVKINSRMSKSDRIEMGDFSEKCAMIISGVSTDFNGHYEKFYIEHYLDDRNECFVLPKGNLNEIISGIIVSNRYLDNEIINVNRSTPTVLSVNDPISYQFI